MKATSLIFGVIIVSLIMSSFGLLFTDLGNNYGANFENETELYDKLSDAETQAYELQSKINESSTDTGLFDVVGQFVGRAVDSLKLTYRSVDSAVSMTETATKDVGLPRQYTTALVVMIIIFIVLAVIISAMVKKDLYK